MNEPTPKSDMVQTVYAAVEEILRRMGLTKLTGFVQLRIEASRGFPTAVRIITDESYKPQS